MRARFLFIVAAILFVASGKAQRKTIGFTHADTVRGSITKERAWWDLLRYDLSIKPDYTAKSTEGKNTITYKVVSNNNTTSLQLDLQAPLVIDSIILNKKASLSFAKDGQTSIQNS